MPAKVRVRLLANRYVTVEQTPLGPGEVIEAPSDEAATLVAEGYAEKLERTSKRTSTSTPKRESAEPRPDIEPAKPKRRAS